MLIDLGLMLGAAAAITIGLDAAGVTDKFTRLHKRSEKDEKEDTQTDFNRNDSVYVYTGSACICQ